MAFDGEEGASSTNALQDTLDDETTQWLKDNKLEFLTDKFIECQATVAILKDFEEPDIRDFATSELKLSSIQRVKLIRAIKSLKNNDHADRSGPKQANFVLIHPKEHDQLQKMESKYNEISHKCGEIQQLNLS